MSWFSDQRWHVPGCECTTDDDGRPISTDPTCRGWSGVVRKASASRDAEVAAATAERIAVAIEGESQQTFDDGEPFPSEGARESYFAAMGDAADIARADSISEQTEGDR